MKRIFGLLLLILGFILTLVGLLFKLESWELANEILLTGLAVCVTSGILLYFKAFSALKSQVGARFKTPLLIIAAGVILIFFGALSKLESWGYASEMLIIGKLLQVTGILLLIYKIRPGIDTDDDDDLNT